MTTARRLNDASRLPPDPMWRNDPTRRGAPPGAQVAWSRQGMKAIADMDMRRSDIDTVPRETCRVCGRGGTVAYDRLGDRLFGAPGSWTMIRCDDPECRTHWLNPEPAAWDLPKLYDRYYTHCDANPKVHSSMPRALAKRLRQAVHDSYRHVYFGYGEGTPSVATRLLGLVPYLNQHLRAHLDFSVFYLYAKPNGRMLEIGCGGGTMLQAMQARGWRVTGLDFDQQAIDNANLKGLNVFHGDLLDQDFALESFDAILMSHVIEHLPDPGATLAACRGLLASGGSLVIVTPNVGGRLHERYGSDWRGLEPPRHLTIFSRNSLERMCRDAGFDRVEIRTTIRDSGYLKLASQDLADGANLVDGRKIGLRRRMKAEMDGFILGWRHFLDPSRGDELVGSCIKD